MTKTSPDIVQAFALHSQTVHEHLLLLDQNTLFASTTIRDASTPAGFRSESPQGLLGKDRTHQLGVYGSEQGGGLVYAAVQYIVESKCIFSLRTFSQYLSNDKKVRWLAILQLVLDSWWQCSARE